MTLELDLPVLGQPNKNQDPIIREAFSDIQNAVNALTNNAAGAQVNALDLGFVGDGVTINDAAFEKASTALAGTGKTLFFPEGIYTLASPATIDDFSLLGVGIFDLKEISGGGTVFRLVGGLETTAKHVITVLHGGAVEGCTFWYPTESVANSTPAITATGYVIRLEDTATRKAGRCRFNYFPGVPYAISNEQGWSEISHNLIAATKVAIHDEEKFAEHQINHNQVTVGLWPGGREGAINAYIAQQAIAFKLTNTLTTPVGNTVFGYNEGVRFEGYGQFFNWLGGLIDGCRYAVRVWPGAGPVDATFTGTTLGSLVAGREGGIRDDYATIESNCVLVGNPAQAVNLSFVNCKAEGANGDLVAVGNTTGAGQANISIIGGDWNNPGRFAHSHTMPVSSVTGTFTASTTSNNGDVITGGTSGAKATVRKNEASKLYLDLYTESPAFTVGETVTGSLSGATAKVTSVAQASRYQVVRFTDKKSSDLLFQGVRSKWEGYQWPAGIWFVEGGRLQVMGNAFTAVTENAHNCIRVDKADRFVEMGNVSTIPGAVNKDLEVVGPVANTPVTGSSSFDR